MALEASSHTSKFAQFTILGVYHRQKLRIFNVGRLVEAASIWRHLRETRLRLKSPHQRIRSFLQRIN
jgi:hypothetical protein